MLRNLVLAMTVLALVACDRPGEPEAAPTESGVEALEEEIDETCAEVSAPEGAPAGVTMMDNFFEPPCIAVSSTQPLTITNAGNLIHNLSIGETGLVVDVEPGGEITTENLGQEARPGTFRFFCEYHENQGMVGTITIE